MYSRREFGEPSPRIPRNYSGNAFREEAPPAVPEPPVEAVVETSRSVEATPEREEAAVPSGRFELGRIFGQGGGIGSEELLLLGLILLISQGEEKDDLLLVLLMLLFLR